MKSIQTMTFYFLIKICFKNDFFFCCCCCFNRCNSLLHSFVYLFLNLLFWIEGTPLRWNGANGAAKRRIGAFERGVAGARRPGRRRISRLQILAVIKSKQDNNTEKKHKKERKKERQKNVACEKEKRKKREREKCENIGRKK